MSDPYRIEGPALVSFSGGRTSGYMLHEIVRAWDGKLPPDVHVCFANTGKEREETLRFVHECGSRWGVPIRWLEWRREGFEEVGFNSASRKGEPFDGLIKHKCGLPNAFARFCTVELKIRTLGKFGKSLGWEKWSNIVGLRYDEGMRIMKALDQNASGENPWTVVMPMSKARVTKVDVMAFWEKQSFDLGLQPHEGNCTMCFLKGAGLLKELMRADPEEAQWWIAHEAANKAPFRKFGEPNYAELLDSVMRQGDLFDGFLDDSEYDAECGLTCA